VQVESTVAIGQLHSPGDIQRLSCQGILRILSDGPPHPFPLRIRDDLPARLADDQINTGIANGSALVSNVLANNQVLRRLVDNVRRIRKE
jgi:hypothetical protein